MPRITRRTLVAAAPAVVAGPSAAAPRPRLAALVTEYRKYSHGQNIVDRFLDGFGWETRHHQPALEVVALYVDQRPAGDLSRERTSRHPGMRIYPTIGEALTLGTGRLAVDGVLVIGEHGNYSRNEKGQTLYPRWEFFEQVVAVFRESGRSVPVFNDKHLSWSWERAHQMVELARELRFPLLAGSSLPVTWRIPAVDLPRNAEVEEFLVVGPGSPDSYDFHALEAAQALVERRRGGEQGVSWLQATRGPGVWAARASGSWEAGGWDPALLEACLCRSHMLKPGRESEFNHTYPTDREMETLTPDPVAYRYEYRDGVRATMLLLDPLVQDITFAARLRGQAEPFSLQFYLGAGHHQQPNFFNPLVRHIETLVTTGKPPYPIERTLLTTGLTAAGVESLWQGGKRLDTPHLAVRYRAPRTSTFRRS